GPAYMDWFRENGYDVRNPVNINEGEGDFLLVGDVILAGQGFRSDSGSHQELERIFGRPVISLNLINPSFFHLDPATALPAPEGAPNGPPSTIAYLPSAFDEPSLAILRER